MTVNKNTIILLMNVSNLDEHKWGKFEKGDLIWGPDRCPEELKRWKIEDIEEAKKELAKYKCTYYDKDYPVYIEEYALEYCECNADGEFIAGSDYDLAEDQKEIDVKRIVDQLLKSNEWNTRLLEELCYLADMENDWEYACEFDEMVAEGETEEDDDYSCAEIARIAAESLGVGNILSDFFGNHRRVY